MNTLTRRQLLVIGAPAIALTPLLLAGCAGFSQAVVNSAAGDALNMANGFAGALATLSTMNIPGLTPAISLKIGAAVSDIQKESQALQSISANTAAQPAVAQIEADINTMLDIAATFPLPPPLSTALLAATVVVPLMEQAVGMIMAQTTSAKFKAVAPTMSPEKARQTLQQLGK